MYVCGVTFNPPGKDAQLTALGPTRGCPGITPVLMTDMNCRATGVDVINQWTGEEVTGRGSRSRDGPHTVAAASSRGTAPHPTAHLLVGAAPMKDAQVPVVIRHTHAAHQPRPWQLEARRAVERG